MDASPDGGKIDIDQPARAIFSDHRNGVTKPQPVAAYSSNRCEQWDGGRQLLSPRVQWSGGFQTRSSDATGLKYAAV